MLPLGLVCDEWGELTLDCIVHLDPVHLGGVRRYLREDVLDGVAPDNGVAVEACVPAVQYLGHEIILRRRHLPVRGRVTARPEDREIAAALQRVLLPPGLPDVAGWALATLYEPAGEAVMVGGDFYDWFVLPDGKVVFFIGDVSGKGPVAGALAMSIRKALKGITWVTLDALASLPILQRAMADEFGEAFATLCLLELTPGSGKARLVLAGHPAPWLRRGGRFEEVVAPANGVLGPFLAAEWKAVWLELEPGDHLLCFSDGLTEARLENHSQFGEGTLQRMLASLPLGLSTYETAAQVYRELSEAAISLDDDVVISVLAFDAPRSAV